MGIKGFYGFVKKYADSSIKKMNIIDLHHTVIGIDFNLMIYKLIMSIRAASGKDILNGNVIVTHIHALLLKLIFFKNNGIKAVFVFDGKPPEIKNNILQKRKETRHKMKKKYYGAKTIDEKKKYFYLKKDISEKELKDCTELIRIFGFPIIHAPQEADTQLAYMSKEGSIEYIISDDADILLFGGKNIIKNFTIDTKKEMNCIELKTIKETLDIDQKDLIKLGISLGSDYCDECPNVSINRAFKIIKGMETYGCDLENECHDAIKYFLRPAIDVKYAEDMTFGDVNVGRLSKYLYKFEYSDAQIEKILSRLKNYKKND